MVCNTKSKGEERAVVKQSPVAFLTEDEDYLICFCFYFSFDPVPSGGHNNQYIILSCFTSFPLYLSLSHTISDSVINESDLFSHGLSRSADDNQSILFPRA